MTKDELGPLGDRRHVVPSVLVRSDERIFKLRKKQGHSSVRSVMALGKSLGSSSSFHSFHGSAGGASETAALPEQQQEQGKDIAVSGNAQAAADDDSVLGEEKEGGCGGVDAHVDEAINMEEIEMKARDSAETRPVVLFLWNGVSSLLVFMRYLVSLDSMFSLVLSVGLTYYKYRQSKDDEHFDGSMNFILLGFAVLMPLSVSVRLTFSRREKALESIAGLQTYAQQLYLCHACWDWGTEPGARSNDPNRWIKHSDEVLGVLISIGDELTRFLTLPNSSFSRHRETTFGRREAAITIAASYRIFGNIVDRHVARLAMLLERLKLAGFSASEASRVRQYEMLMTKAVHHLRMLKMYRSPKALNALLNLTTTLLPPFYAPAFAQIAHDSESLGMGLAFAAITALALTALYESVQVLEDPFVAFLTLDGIDVYEELAVLYYHQLIETRKEIFPNAPMYENETTTTVPTKEDEMPAQGTNDENFIDEVDGSGGGNDGILLDRRTMLVGHKGENMKSIRLTSSDHHRGRRRGLSLQAMKRMSVYQFDLPDECEESSLRSSRLSVSLSGAGHRVQGRRSSVGSAGGALDTSIKGADDMTSIKE